MSDKELAGSYYGMDVEQELFDALQYEVTCECNICVYGRLVEENLMSLPATQKDFFEDMYDRLCNAENDLHVCNSILDGSWPSAKAILTNSLTKCRDEDDS